MRRATPGRSGGAAAGGAGAAGPVHARWQAGKHAISLDRPVIMGVVNVTPDSFSDGGRHLDPRDAAQRAGRLAREGADLIDVGAESTRPGAEPVPADEEWRRLGPALERMAGLSVPISVDTRKSGVARRALEAGASVVNDVSGLADDPELADLAAESGAGLVLMHMRGDPGTMQEDTAYEDLIDDVTASLSDSVERARAAGCDPEQLVVDPGIGFGKSARGSLRLLARAGAFERAGAPVLVGPSRKSFIGETLGLAVDERVEATAAACVLALERGARLFRVHDVRAVRRALDMAAAIRSVDGSRPRDGAGGGDAGGRGGEGGR